MTATTTFTTFFVLAATFLPTNLGIKINEIHRPIVLTSKPSLSRQPRQRFPDGHLHPSSEHYHHQAMLPAMIIIIIMIITIIHIISTSI
jgi:hypothetical protein